MRPDGGGLPRPDGLPMWVRARTARTLGQRSLCDARGRVTLTGTVSSELATPPRRARASTNPCRCAPCAGEQLAWTSATPTPPCIAAERGRLHRLQADVGQTVEVTGPLAAVTGGPGRLAGRTYVRAEARPAGTPTIGRRRGMSSRCTADAVARVVAAAGADARPAAPAYAAAGTLIGNIWKHDCRMWPPCSNNGDQYVPPPLCGGRSGVETSWPLPRTPDPAAGTPRAQAGLHGGSCRAPP